MNVDKDTVRAEYEKGGYTYQKVADKFNININTVKSWAKRDKDEGNPWIKGNGNKVATKEKKLQPNKKVATEREESVSIEDNNDELNATNDKKQSSETNLINKVGAPIGSKNALGNKGGSGGPKRNKKAEVHGFFSKYLPEETLELAQQIQEKPYIDILWENITIQYATIIRAQRIMYVKDQEDSTQLIKKQKIHASEMSSSSETEYEHHMSWDKQATFLQAQSRAMGELRSMIKQYDELVNSGLATEEQRLRIEKLKVDIDKVNTINEDKPIEIIIKNKDD